MSCPITPTQLATALAGMSPAQLAAYVGSLPPATTAQRGMVTLAVAADYPQPTNDTEAVTPAHLAAALASLPVVTPSGTVPAATDTVPGITALAVGANYPSTSNTEATTPQYVTTAVAAAIAALPTATTVSAATDTVPGISALAVAANYPSTSDTEAATPMYVASAVGGVSTYNLGATGAAPRTYTNRLQLEAWISDFADPSGGADRTAQFAAARAWLLLTRGSLNFEPGTYTYATSPNWAISYAEVKFHGRVTFNHTGTGSAILMDAGATAVDLVYGLRFGTANQVHVNPKSTSAATAVFIQSVHHSHIGINVHGAASATLASITVSFAVCTVLNITVSGNEGGWAAGAATPAIGLLLKERLPNETVSYCLFPNILIEGPAVGIDLTNTLGNVFLGGTSEGCPTLGVTARTGAQWDRFIGVDFEANGADVYCVGDMVSFQQCDTDALFTFGPGARRCTLRDGGHKTVDVQAGATGNNVLDIVYNRLVNGGTFTDNGTATELRNVSNGVTPFNAFLTASAFPAFAGPLAQGAAATETVTVAGAKPGDFFEVSSLPASGTYAPFLISAHCTAANTVTVHFLNVSGASANRPGGTLWVKGSRGRGVGS